MTGGIYTRILSCRQISFMEEAVLLACPVESAYAQGCMTDFILKFRIQIFFIEFYGRNLYLNWAAYSELLKQQLTKAQLRMKQYANQKRSLQEFQVGDKVFLKLQPYDQSSVVNRPYPRLSYKYYGPYPIVERIGTAAYKLQLPEGALIHPVFHVLQLKPQVPNYTPVFSSLPHPVDFSLKDVQPEAIMDRRLVKKGNSAHVQVLIKWTSLPATVATWEDYDVLRTRAGGDVTIAAATDDNGSARRQSSGRDSAGKMTTALED